MYNNNTGIYFKCITSSIQQLELVYYVKQISH